jgi:hypothetical protein
MADQQRYQGVVQPGVGCVSEIAQEYLDRRI